MTTQLQNYLNVRNSTRNLSDEQFESIVGDLAEQLEQVSFIPQYTVSAAPGGAYTTQIGSYIKLSPISVSGANTSIGTWA